ncbi:hypothetical protein BOKEGFJH_00053 [Chlamydia avium]|nr:hypothetical protein [Chlamydia avium]EPP37780.1 hypothetical protein CP10743SC13_0369 [Chlamydia psittaci 10_743_SC13]VVT42544.1 hypothetical protein BOKEGFJH_00053 [Chlamydia avium]
MTNPILPSQITSTGSNSVAMFSKEELAVQRNQKILKVAIVSLLSTLAIGVGIAGITLTATLGSPIFLSLLIASVLFASVAILAYINLTKNADGNWLESLDLYFRQLPGHAVSAQFTPSRRTKVSCYQSKANPGVKLMIQEDPAPPFQLPLLAIPKTWKHRGSAPHHSILFNAVDNNDDNTINLIGTNQGGALFAAFTRYHKTNELRACQYTDNSLTPTPFSPTEVRTCQLSVNEVPDLPASLKQTIPTHLGHARGPKIEDFYGDDQEVKNKYYERALITYGKCIDEAIKQGCSVISLPLFSSVYELDARSFFPKPGKDYTSPLECQNLCKKALVEAVQSAALRYPISKKLLVILQDPFFSFSNRGI